jgi:hypothetical protein
VPGGWGEARLQKLALGVGPGKCATPVAFTAEPGLIDITSPPGQVEQRRMATQHCSLEFRARWFSSNTLPISMRVREYELV